MASYASRTYAALIGGLIFASVAAAEDPAPNPDYVKPKGAVDDERCETELECKPAPEVNQNCYHYCTPKDCQYAKLCPAMHVRGFFARASCVEDAPCIRPSAVSCQKGYCVSE